MIIQLKRLQSLKIESLNLTATLCDLDSPLFHSLKRTTPNPNVYIIYINIKRTRLSPDAENDLSIETILAKIVS